MMRMGAKATMIAVGLLLCLSVMALCLKFQPFISVSVERELVDVPGAEYSHIWGLLRNRAPLEDVKKAIRGTGKDPEEIAVFGESLLVKAVREGREDIVVWLIDQGYDPNHIDSNFCALETAIYADNPDMVRLLLQHGADPNLQLANGWTPLRRAEADGNEEILQAFRSGSIGPTSQEAWD